MSLSPATTASASASVEPLGDSPSGCPGPSPRFEEVADFVGPVAGASPLWAGFYATYDPATNAYSAEDAPWTEHGWRIKILHLLEPGQEAPIEMSGNGVGMTSGTVYLEVEGAGPSARATFDPESQPATHGGWREFPTYAYFPSAGCYRLTANWPGGSWEMGFGIGR